MMRTSDLEDEFASAVDSVEQVHLDRVRALGVDPAALANVGAAHPPFGIITGSVERGRFVPGDGPAHIVQPVVQGGELVDLVMWRSANPQRWSSRTGDGWLMNADACLGSRWDGGHLVLHATPLGWLSGAGVGGVVVDWSSQELGWLRGFATIQCADEMLAATLRRAISKPASLPLVRSMGRQRGVA
jgi:hypothetical protein